MHINDR